jgi:hypothetical protein
LAAPGLCAMIHRRIAITLALALAFVASRPVISAEPKAPAQSVEQNRRVLETALLPIIVDTVTMPPAVDIRPGVGGGIAVVNGTVIIVGPQGAFVAVSDRGKVFRRLPLPALPNHAEEYVDFARKPVQAGPFLVNTGFRVHDVEVRAGEGGVRLFVSYERYISEVRTTALAVSAISLDKNLQPLGSWQDVYESQPLDSEWYSGIAGGGRMLLRTNAKSHVSIGHRNPQGLTLTANGTMYATEHGPQGGDELNRIVQGKNYGWPIETYGAHYGKYDWPAQAKSAQPFEKPVLAWVPSIGVSNLIEIDNFHPAWNGDLLVESLKAQSLFRLRRDGDGRVVYSEPIPLGQRLRDIAALPDGTLVLWTDSAQLIFLSVDYARLAANQRPPL